MTATYLCVLIVNNTWLDCDLLEVLCNGSLNINNAASRNKSAATELEGDERQVADGSSLELRALESVLGELIAFAGGGGGSNSPLSLGVRHEETQDSSQHGHDPNSARLYLEPRRQADDVRDKGGGAPFAQLVNQFNNENELLRQLLLYGQTLRKDDLTTPREPLDLLGLNQRAQVARAKTVRLSHDEDGSGTPDHLLALRHNQSRVQPSNLFLLRPQDNLEETPESGLAQGRLSTKMVQEESEQPAATTLPPLAMPATSTTLPGNSLASWMGRPFRNWSSYSFWSSSNEAPSGASGRQEEVSQHRALQQDQRQMQFLRPIDRTEQFNDIATNQSSFKLAPGVAQQQQQQQQQLPFSGHRQYQFLEQQQPQQLEQSRLQMTGEQVSTQHNGLLLASGSANNNGQHSSQVGLFAVGASPVSPSSVFLTTDLVSQTMESGESGTSSQPTFTSQQLRSSTTPAMPQADLLGALEFVGPPALVVQNARRQPDREREIHHHLVQQQQQPTGHQFQEDQAGTSTGECKCNELDQFGSSPSPLAFPDCRYRCLLSTSTQATTQASLADSTQVATSFTATSTTVSPSGKMNPLDVTFLLYTRYHRDLANDLIQINAASGIQQLSPSSNLMNVGEVVDSTNETTLSESRFNSSLPIKIVIHGFGSGGRRPWVTDMVSKLLDYEDVNVIVVDWEKGAALPNYVQAAGNTRLVGHRIATLIKSINSKFGLTGNSYHLIGFSLGAHVAGFAGTEIRNSTSNPRLWINRITGLDPASPLFEGYEANDRLDPSDAQFVDVIHSNGDGVLRGGFGSLQPMGHVDFYPNGGRVQVGCNSVLLSALSDIIYGKWQSLCNHRRALNFFMDSFEFSGCRFRSFNCDSYENYLKGECFDCGLNNEKCSYMGYLANYSKGRGKMYLTTHEEAPFCGE